MRFGLICTCTFILSACATNQPEDVALVPTRTAPPTIETTVINQQLHALDKRQQTTISSAGSSQTTSSTVSVPDNAA